MWATTSTSTTTTTETTDPGLTTVWDTIESRSDLTEFATLLKSTGLDATLQDSSISLTVFAPDNDALNAIDLPTDEAGVEALVRRHLLQGEQLTVEQITANQTIDVSGTTYDVTADPATVGGAGFVAQDLQEVNGYTQVMDAVLTAAS